MLGGTGPGHCFFASVRRPCRTSQRAAVVPAASKRALTDILNSPELDARFHLLYELKPPAAREQFDAWQKSHPEDPLGIAAEGEPAICLRSATIKAS